MIKNPFGSKVNLLKTDAAKSIEPSLMLEPMTNHRLDELVHQISPDVTGEIGYWQLNVDGRDVLVITDEAHNRMRVICPIAYQDDIDEAELIRCLEANFNSALDAKYALRNQALWSVFTHPLAQLTDEQFMDCAAQVVNLANNFGSSYASSNLTFGGK